MAESVPENWPFNHFSDNWLFFLPGDKCSHHWPREYTWDFWPINCYTSNFKSDIHDSFMSNTISTHKRTFADSSTWTVWGKLRGSNMAATGNSDDSLLCLSSFWTMNLWLYERITSLIPGSPSCCLYYCMVPACLIWMLRHAKKNQTV